MASSKSGTRVPLWRKLQALTWAERRLIFEATWWLAVLGIALHVVPFKRLAAWMGLLQSSTEQPYSTVPRAEARAVGWAVRAAAAHTPWTSTCLAQALAGAQMLRRRGIDSALTLGVLITPGAAQRMEAHAWLKQGGVFLTGEGGHERFTPISTFVIGAAR